MKTVSINNYIELCRRHPGVFPDEVNRPVTQTDNIVTLSEREDLAGGMGGYLPIPHCSLCGRNHWRDCEKVAWTNRSLAAAQGFLVD